MSVINLTESEKENLKFFLEHPEIKICKMYSPDFKTPWVYSKDIWIWRLLRIIRHDFYYDMEMSEMPDSYYACKKKDFLNKLEDLKLLVPKISFEEFKIQLALGILNL